VQRARRVCYARDRRIIRRRCPILLGKPADHAVQRTTVEQPPAQFTGQRRRQCAFPGATGAIQGNDRSSHPGACATAVMPRPQAAASSAKAGNEVATLAQSLMVIGAWARSAAMAKAMAMR